MHKLNKIYTLLLLILVLTSCGFKPIYKTNENNFENSSYSIKFNNNPSYIIQNKILETYNVSSADSFYTILLSVNQASTPLITNTNGTVSKYRVEIEVYFDVNETVSNKKVYSDVARGFDEYLVQTSEIETDEKLKQAVEIATHEAVQMMSIKIQSNLLQ